MRVQGTVLINYDIKLDGINDITEDAMPMYEPDILIAKEIDRHLPNGFYVEGDIYVRSSPVYKEGDV